jgi:hypothetical protein
MDGKVEEKKRAHSDPSVPRSEGTLFFGTPWLFVKFVSKRQLHTFFPSPDGNKQKTAIDTRFSPLNWDHNLFFFPAFIRCWRLFCRESLLDV